MDEIGFDHLARRIGMAVSRRGAMRTLAGGLLGGVLGRSGALPAAAAPVESAACLGIGARCGRRKQPGCGKCCSSYTTRQRRSRQRRCSCKPDLKRCRRPDECCSGVCLKAPCVGINRPRCIPGIFGKPEC